MKQKSKALYFFLCIFILSQHSYSYTQNPSNLTDIEYSSDILTSTEDFEYTNSENVNKIDEINFEETDDKVIKNLIKEIRTRYPNDTEILDKFLDGELPNFTDKDRNFSLLTLLRNIVAKNAYTEAKEKILKELQEKSETTGRAIRQLGDLEVSGNVSYDLGEDNLPSSCFETKTNKYGAKENFQICPHNEGFEEVWVDITETKKDDSYYGKVFFHNDNKDQNISKVIDIEFDGENEITTKSLNTEIYFKISEYHQSYKDYAKERDIRLLSNICSFYGKKDQNCNFFHAPTKISVKEYFSTQNLNISENEEK